jgi:hypothetical protein
MKKRSLSGLRWQISYLYRIKNHHTQKWATHPMWPEKTSPVRTAPASNWPSVGIRIFILLLTAALIVLLARVSSSNILAFSL